MRSPWQFLKTLWSKDKDLWSEDKTRTRTCKLVLEDPRGQGLSSRTTTLYNCYCYTVTTGKYSWPWKVKDWQSDGWWSRWERRWWIGITTADGLSRTGSEYWYGNFLQQPRCITLQKWFCTIDSIANMFRAVGVSYINWYILIWVMGDTVYKSVIIMADFGLR